MFKIIGLELKKIVSRPGIYILAALLAVLLTVSAIVYSPEETKRVYNTLNGVTVQEMYYDFSNNHKKEYDSAANHILEMAQNLNAKTNEDYKAEIDGLLESYIADGEDFSELYLNPTATSEAKLTLLKAMHNEELTGSLDVLNARLVQLLGDPNNEVFTVTTTRTNYSKLVKTFTEAKDSLDLNITNSDFETAYNNFTQKYSDDIKDAVDNLKYPKYSDFIDKYAEEGNYYSVTLERQEVVVRKMEMLVDSATKSNEENLSKANMQEMNDLYNEYRLVTEIYENLFKASTKVALIEAFSNQDRNNIVFVENPNYYEEKETITRNNYFFTNDITDHFAHALSFDYASNEKKNGYDYAYFTLAIFGVVIIIYAIMRAAHSIAGETKEGTLRFVAMKPVTRTSIFLGKYLSTAIISFILIAFSLIASLVVGGAVFGFKSAEILTIINATEVVTIKPILSLLLFALSLFIQLLVYTSFAMMFSAMLRSDLLALAITLSFYAFNLVLPIFFSAYSWLRFYPFANLNLYAFVGAGTMEAKTLLGRIFTSVVYSGMTIWISLIFIVAIITVFNFVTSIVFKKKEL